MDTFTIIEESKPTKKVDISLRQLIDIDETGGIMAGTTRAVGKIEHNQILTAYAEVIDQNGTLGKVKSFRFKNLTSLLQGGTGITVATDKDGLTTITNSGVTKIIAGSNISISPVGGTGNVTINSTGGGATPTGYYGAFQDNTTQLAAAINTPYAVKLNTTDLSDGITIVNNGSGDPTRITIANTGIYNIQFSLQLEKNGGSGNMTADIWLRKNGVDIPSTTGKVVLTGSASASPVIAAWNYVLDVVAGDYYELMWAVSNIHVEIFAEAATPPHPATPSAILTVTQQSGIMAGTGMTALNSLTAAAQTFVNDANVSIVSSGTTHTLTWLGTLADSRIASAATWNAKFTLPALTSGSVLFSNGTTIAQDNTAFSWDNTNKRLNLVSSGDNLLNLTPSASANAAVINSSGYIKFNASAVSYIRGFSTATAFAVYNSAYTNIFNIGTTAACYVNTGSNFLIGTTTDAGFKLDDNGTSMFRDTMNFRNTVNMDSAPLGSELATTASGTNWAGTSFATGYTHTTGSVVALTSALTATNGFFYQITITVTGRTLGNFTINYAGESLAGLTASGGFGIKATATTALNIVPTTDFDGTIVLSVKQINTSTASMSWQTNGGTVVNEFRNSSSNNNLFFGTGAGQRNTSGSQNTFIGSLAGQSHTSGTSNVFVGHQAGINTTRGVQNVFVGTYAGQSSVTTTQNVYMGYFSGAAATGSSNSFYGAYTGQNSTGSNNAFFGWQAGSSNTSGISNVAIGFQALLSNLTGGTNVVIGNQAGRYISGGATAATVLNTSVIIGANAYPLADSQNNQIVIGYNAVGAGSNTATIGNTSITDTILRARVNIQQYATGSRPAYVKGALIYDSTLGKLVIGGNAGWEVVTSI